MSTSGTVFETLVDDAALLGAAVAAAAAVAGHRTHRAAWYAPVVGPLVVPDTLLGQLGRLAAPGPSGPSEPAEPIEVSVVTSGGAGGLAALARRLDQGLPGVSVVAAETALRDLDDLAGNAARVAAAAAELGPEVEVYVELPYAPGWIPAVAEVEAAGLLGHLRSDGSGTDRLAEQLSVLVEADLGFKISGPIGAGDVHAGRGLVTVLMAIDALVDGSDPSEAARLLQTTDRDRITAAAGSWSAAAQQRIRRRLRSVDGGDVSGLVTDLVGLGLLDGPA